ncbi:MAG: hypothetical protein II098_02945 [Treponema sp.]|nr:hypothetical protein [Treponema sp.]
MKKLLGSFTAAVLALSMIFTACQNDSDSNNSMLLLALANNSNTPAAAASTTKNAAAAALKINAAAVGSEVDLDGYSFNSKTALTIAKAITVKNANLGGGSITVTAGGVKLSKVTNGSASLKADTTLDNCNFTNVVVGSYGSRDVSSLKLSVKDGEVAKLAAGANVGKIVLKGKANLAKLATKGTVSVKVASKDVKVAKSAVKLEAASAEDLDGDETLDISEDDLKSIQDAIEAFDESDLAELESELAKFEEEMEAAAAEFAEEAAEQAKEDAKAAYDAAEADINNAVFSVQGLSWGGKAYTDEHDQAKILSYIKALSSGELTEEEQIEKMEEFLPESLINAIFYLETVEKEDSFAKDYPGLNALMNNSMPEIWMKKLSELVESEHGHETHGAKVEKVTVIADPEDSSSAEEMTEDKVYVSYVKSMVSLGCVFTDEACTIAATEADVVVGATLYIDESKIPTKVVKITVISDDAMTEMTEEKLPVSLVKQMLAGNSVYTDEACTTAATEADVVVGATLYVFTVDYSKLAGNEHEHEHEIDPNATVTVMVVGLPEGAPEEVKKQVVPVGVLSQMSEHYTFYSDEDCTKEITELSAVEAGATIYAKAKTSPDTPETGDVVTIVYVEVEDENYRTQKVPVNSLSEGAYYYNFYSDEACTAEITDLSAVEVGATVYAKKKTVLKVTVVADDAEPVQGTYTLTMMKGMLSYGGIYTDEACTVEATEADVVVGAELYIKQTAPKTAKVIAVANGQFSPAKETLLVDLVEMEKHGTVFYSDETLQTKIAAADITDGMTVYMKVSSVVKVVVQESDCEAGPGVDSVKAMISIDAVFTDEACTTAATEADVVVGATLYIDMSKVPMNPEN